jgi:hypothetical protein
MKENPADIVTERILARTAKVSDHIAKRLKNTKPYATEIIPPSVKIWAVDNLGIMDMQEITQQYGLEAVSELIAEAEKLRADGRRTK